MAAEVRQEAEAAEEADNQYKYKTLSFIWQGFLSETSITVIIVVSFFSMCYTEHEIS